MTTAYQTRTYLGKTTLIDRDASGWYSVILSYGPLAPAEHTALCRTLTEAELYARKHNWPVPGDELEAV